MEVRLVDPDLMDVFQAACDARSSKRLRTLFSATEGVTHEGKHSAASISRNSPSESRTLKEKDILEGSR